MNTSVVLSKKRSLVALATACAIVATIPMGALAYGEASYYAQSSYYTQSSYQSSYYQQGSYYSGGTLAGTQIYATPGTYQFTVPAGVTAIRTLVVGGGGGGGGGAADWGGGGGGGCGAALAGGALSVSAGQTYSVTVGAGGAGGASHANNGAAGGVSQFGSITAAGGSYGGSGYYGYPNTRGPAGGSGGGSGGGGGGNAYPGFYAIPGSGGPAGAQTNSTGSGGNCTGSGWSIDPATYVTKISFSAGTGGYAPSSYAYCGGGGGGGVTLASSTVNGTSGLAPTSGTYGPACAPNGGTGYGAGGGGSYYGGGPAYGGAGAPGVVYIEWVSPPTCSVTFDSNPAAYGTGTTIRWSSEYADNGFTINNVGPVTPNTSGSAHVEPTVSTNYTGTVWNSLGVSATCAATLTVSSPSTPTATVTSSAGSTMNIGESSTITATFSPGSGDSLTSANIDSPLGTGLGADTNPTNPKVITFTPTTAGTYTFYARAQTAYYTSWATYGQVTVTVLAPCTLGGVTLQSGESQSFYSTQTSSGALCSSVAQTRTCTDGVLSGSASYQYASCVCAPLYSCSGNDVTYTNASCAVSTVASCTLPSFCSPGSAACLNPEPAFNAGAGTTGHLQAAPSLVARGATAQIYWNVSNVESCSVSENNPDISNSWTGLSGAHITSALSQQTIYSLTCIALEGASPASFTENVTVNVAPIFQEQ